MKDERNGREHNTLRLVMGHDIRKPAPTGRQIIARGFIPWINGEKNHFSPNGAAQKR